MNIENFYGYTPVFDEVTEETDPLASLVYGFIWRMEKLRQGICTAAKSTMAKKLGVSVRTIERKLDLLIEKNWIEDATPQKKHQTHAYKTKRTIEIAPVAYSSSTTESRTSATESQTECDIESHKDTIKDTIKDEMPAKADKRDPLLDHPAIKIYREIMRLHISIAWRPIVAETVGEDEESLNLWKKVVLEWNGMGWNKTNVIGMLEVFKEGGLKKKTYNHKSSEDFQTRLNRRLNKIEEEEAIDIEFLEKANGQ